jgi:hypothetical protein
VFAAAALNRLIGYGVLGLAVAVPALRRPPADVAGSAADGPAADASPPDPGGPTS